LPARDGAARGARARCQQPLDALGAARVDHVPGALDVHHLELGGGGGEAVQRRSVDDRVAAADRATEPAGVERVDPAVAKLMPGPAGLARNVPADEAACAGDVDPHRGPTLL